jgi:hypothetical protein
VEVGATKEHIFEIWARNVVRGKSRVKNVTGWNSGDAERKKGKRKQIERRKSYLMDRCQ